jgi:AcrR family transcriptional regulator
MSDPKENATISESRQRLLDTAQDLFHERGYRAVTMQDIARMLGVRQASLYYHVPNGKEQLFVEVVRRNFDQHRRGLLDALGQVGDTLEHQLRAAAMWFASQPPMSLLGMMHADMPALSAENHRRLSQYAAYCFFEPIAAVFAEAMARGEIRLLQPDLLAGSFLALMDGVSYSAQSQPGTPPRHAMANAIVSLMLDGLRPRAAQQGE